MKTISRQAYADMFGPTTGDRLVVVKLFVMVWGKAKLLVLSVLMF